MDNIQLFYAFALISIFLVLGSYLTSRFVVMRNTLLLKLKSNHLTTKAIVTKFYDLKGMPWITYNYETKDGMQKGNSAVLKGSNYKAGDELELAYLESDPKVSCPKEALVQNIGNAHNVIKIFRYLPVYQIACLAVLWFILIKQYIVPLPQ